MNTRDLRKSNFAVAIALLLFCTVIFFHDLGKFPIYMWDEARYANNSLEMLLNGDFLNVKMDGQIDLWNFKPPLVLWLQVASMKIFGISEWAVRLPSALAGLGIAGLMFWFCTVVLKSRLLGITSVLFLMASGGFLHSHIARSADLDAVLTFFLFTYSILFIHYLFYPKNPLITFIILSFLVVCAFLSKGLPGFFLLPFLFILSLLHNNHQKVFPYKILYILGCLVLLASVGYYWLRELALPGYWELLKKSEFNRFSGEGLGWHIQPFTFYIQNFITLQRFYPFIYLLLFTLTVLKTGRTKQIRRFYLYILIISVGYLLFISYPTIKLAWYDAPLYPFFCLMLGMGVTEGVFWLKQRFFSTFSDKVIHGVIALIMISLCFKSYQHIWEKTTYHPAKMAAEWEAEGILIKQLFVAWPAERDYTVFKEVKSEIHYDQIKFYQKAYGRRYGYKIAIKNKVIALKPNEKVLIFQSNWLDSIQNRFPIKVLFESEQGKLILLK